VRCERAGALLREKIETDESVANLNIKGVYQLQGGIDKYFKMFPEGGHWVGKNYTFDKRFSHVPESVQDDKPLTVCEDCSKPWDRFRGKRRCPTCGVPSIICTECFEKNSKSDAQCALCKLENVKTKKEVKEKEKKELEEYESKMSKMEKIRPPPSQQHQEQDQQRDRNGYDRNAVSKHVEPAPNPDKTTRIWIGNLCKRTVTEESLSAAIPEIKFLQWINSYDGSFKGCCFAEMITPEAAAYAVGLGASKHRCCGRPVFVNFAPNDGKSIWPPKDKVSICE